MTGFCLRGLEIHGGESGCFRSFYMNSAELELGAAHDESGQQVEGVGGVGCGNFADLFVDELVGLRRDFATDECGFDDVKGYVGASGFGGWYVGGEDGFSVAGMLGRLRCGCGLGHETEGQDVGRVELLVGEFVAGEGVGEVEAVDQGAGVHPVIGGDVVAGRRKSVVERHAHGLDGVDECTWVGWIGSGGAKGGGEELHGGFDFVAEVFAGVELG